MTFEPGSWQETVNNYDRKAHRKNAYITVTFIGGFRAMDDEGAAGRVLHYKLEPDEAYAELLATVISDLQELMPKAEDLDERIDRRSKQRPIEREYLYGN